MGLSWYVIRTKPRCDRLAAASLERNGFDLFFPRVRVVKPRGRKVVSPLFPGYLFLHHDAETHGWASVLRLPGILAWVKFGGVAPVVPDQVVDELAERVDAINDDGGLWTRFKRGDTVRVVTGKIDNLAEVVEAPGSPKDRVRVLLDFMGRLVPAVVSWEHLRPVTDASGGNEYRQSRRRTRGHGRWIRGFGPRAVVGT